MASPTPPTSPLPLSPSPQQRTLHALSANSFAFAPTSPSRQHPLYGGGAAPTASARISPRQVKLQRVEPPASTLRLPLRDHVAANFHHELFQFHQMLRDAVAKCEYDDVNRGHKRSPLPRTGAKHAAGGSSVVTSSSPPSTPLVRFDRSVLELLTSDRGDAVLKEFFRQWHRTTSAAGVSSNDADLDEQQGTEDVLWDVFETFFKSVPLVLPESEVGNTKSYYRYLDALRSLRDVLFTLLFKRPSAEQRSSDNDDDDADDDSASETLLGSNGRSLSLLLSSKTVSLSASVSLQHPQQSSSQMKLQPMHVYCRQLERELNKLRERHPSRSRVAGFRASFKCSERQDVGLLNDATVLLLLDFWELPRTERLGFFCQIASQTCDDDAAMVLRVFLDNCSTHNFLQVWDALQQAPQFESTFSTAARQYCAALQQSSSNDASALGESTPSSSGTAEGDDSSDATKKQRASERHRRTSRAARQSLSLQSSSPGRHRPSRFVDLNGLTEVFEERDDDDGNAHEYGDSDSDSDRDSDGSKRRFHKILIHERGRTPPDERHTSPHKTHRRRRRQQSSRHDSHSNAPGSPPASAKSTTTAAASPPYQLPPVNPHASLMQRLHDDLVEIIKQDELSTSSNHVAPPVVMDSVWKLLELLDKGKHAGGSFHRHATGGVASRQSSVSGFDAIDRSSGPLGPSRASSIRQDASSLSQQQPRQALLLDANLTRDQQFVIKLDQLQSLLTALGAFSLHEMATETISSVYRRMPALVQLFSSVHDKTYEAAGMDAPASARTSGSGFDSGSGSLTHNQHPHQHIHHHASMPNTTWQQQHRAASSMLLPASSGSPDDQVVEAAGLLMAKVSKIVRSLANLDQLSVANGNGSDGKSASLDVLALLKLADDMESAEVVTPVNRAAPGPNEPSASGNGRRVSMLDHSRRLAILHKLKTLAMSNEIDAVATMVADTVKDVQEQHVQQREQIEKLSSAASTKSRRPHRRAPPDVLLDTEDGDDASDDDDGADEVLKMAKKAKTRRASAAKAQQQQQSQAAPSDPTGSDNDDDNDGDDSSRLRTGRRDVLLPFRQTNGPQKGIKLFSVAILLRIIYQIYREHYEGMVASLQYGSRRMEFSEFLYDWHIRKYGLKTLAQQHLLKLIQSLRKFEKKTFQCQLCLRFLGIQSPLGYHEHKFVLSLLDKWSLGTFAGATKHRVEHTPRQFKLRLAFALSSLQDALMERFGVYFRSMDTVASRVRAHAMTTPGDEDFVKETDVLRIAIDEWVLQRQRLEQILEAVYVAGDVNGDGGLEYDEFAAVVAHLSPIADDKLLQKVFAAAHDVVKPPRRISFERFLDVILLEKLFHTSPSSSNGNGATVRSSAASGSGAGATKPTILGDDSSSSRSNPNATTRVAGTNGSSTLATLEDEEAYQFDLLQQTWEHDRDIVTNALKLITHQQTAASLTFRVAFLTQILLKRVDSKTAWMCHKQIMREISRYQNLNEEQIVVLKTKEETFRKAVLAITHLRKVGALLGTSSTSITASLNESHVHDDDDPTMIQDASTVGDGNEGTTHKYTTAVEQSLEGLERRPSTQDMAALEDKLRETFLAQADTTAIDDFKSALQQLRRMSLHNGSLSHEQLATLLAPALPPRIERLDEDDGEEDDQDNDGDDDGDDEEETGDTGEEAAE